jgi:tRNA(Ile)-lysidine synthase
MRAGDRVAAAVSAGADSVALLLLLLELRHELGIVLSLAHVNHQLRGEESDEDERFAAQLARQHQIELHVCDAPVDVRHGAGIEAAARELRYDFFRRLAREGRVTRVATAHTLDDQAETLLLRIFRGTGIRGLAGIHPRISLQDHGRTVGEVVRPLLGFRRATLLEFLSQHNQSWREDSSNREATYLRNRVRHWLLPVIVQEFGEAAIEHMSELAEIARAEEEHWQLAVANQGQEQGQEQRSRPSPSLGAASIAELSLAARRRLVRAWLEANAPDVTISFRLIEETLRLFDEPAGKKVELTSGWDLRRGRHELVLESDAGRQPAKAASNRADYHYVLPVPGVAEVPELGTCFEARVVERYWPAHSSEKKKIKELLSERHAVGPQKKLWPVAEAEGRGLVWMRGFAVPGPMQVPAGALRAIWIREIQGTM